MKLLNKMRDMATPFLQKIEPTKPLTRRERAREITVNGKKLLVEIDYMTFWQCLNVAGMDQLAGPFVIHYTIPPTMGDHLGNGGKGGQAGTLHVGSPVEVRNGSEFTVTKIS